MRICRRPQNGQDLGGAHAGTQWETDGSQQKLTTVGGQLVKRNFQSSCLVRSAHVTREAGESDAFVVPASAHPFPIGCFPDRCVVPGEVTQTELAELVVGD